MKGESGTLILIALLSCYVTAYLGMTLTGGYIPFTSGTNGIKDWICKGDKKTDAKADK